MNNQSVFVIVDVDISLRVIAEFSLPYAWYYFKHELHDSYYMYTLYQVIDGCAQMRYEFLMIKL